MRGPRLPDIGSRYGAPMGRVDSLPYGYRGAVRVARVRLDSGGYDSGGAYWGRQRARLYQARADDPSGGEGYFLAADRHEALGLARLAYPAARLLN